MAKGFIPSNSNSVAERSADRPVYSGNAGAVPIRNA
jgi:hypothetical protein